jgi:hypothetical protein
MAANAAMSPGPVCVYYYSTYYKAVRVCVGGETMEDMSYVRLRAEACVD